MTSTTAITSLLCLALALCASTVVQAADGDLKYIIFLHRHGDRGPVSRAPIMTDEQFNTAWPLGEGQLTGVGMRQLYNVGVGMRKRYVGPNAVNPNFLNPTWDWREYAVRSTDVNRTLQSAQSLLFGLYPLGTGQANKVEPNNSIPQLFQPVPITTLPTSEDQVLRGVSWAGKYCPNYQKKQREYEQTDAYKKKNQDNQALYARVAAGTGYKIEQLDDIYGAADNFVTDAAHGYNNFPNVTKADKDASEKLVSFWAKAEVSDKDERMMMSGVLMGRILEHIEASISGRSKLKAMHYSGHDSTVFPLLAALGIFDGNNPPYGSHIVFELRESTTDTTGYQVVTYFLDKPVTFPWCKNVNCPYSTFKAYFDDYTPNSIDDLCGIEAPGSAGDGHDNNVDWTPFTVGMAAALAFFAGASCLLLGTTIHYKKKASDPQQQLMTRLE